MKKILFSFCLFVLSFIGKAQPFINPGETGYFYIGAAGNSSSLEPQEIFRVTDPSQCNTFNKIATITGAKAGNAERINGVGLNQKDGFLYGMSFPVPRQALKTNFYRIKSDGVATFLGEIEPQQILRIINTSAGMVDASDNYWFTAFVFNGIGIDVYLGKVPRISEIGINPAVSTGNVEYKKIDITDPPLQTAFKSFLDHLNWLDPLSSKGGVADLAFHPNGKIYTYMSYPDASNHILGRPVVIDTISWIAKVVGTAINPGPDMEMSGVMCGVDNNLYVLFANGQYGTVDLSSGLLSSLKLSNLPRTVGNLRGDLASNALKGTPLPIKLIAKSFTGKVSGNANLLQWKSAEEVNFNKFILEKSTNGKDFAAFTEIPAKGSNSSYQYEDQNVNDQVINYRMKMVDIDGTSEYSPVIVVNRLLTGITASVYPTMVNNEKLFIRSNANTIAVTVADMSGKVLVSQQFTGTSQTHEISLSSLSAGMYIVMVNNKLNGQIITTQKVIKK